MPTAQDFADMARSYAERSPHPERFDDLPARSMTSLEGWTGWTDEQLAGITAPTLICGGKYDDIAPTARAEAMLNRLPNAEMKEFEGGHLFFMEDRAAWPAMMDFLLAG